MSEEKGIVKSEQTQEIAPVMQSTNGVEFVKERLQMISRLYKEVLKENVHYGVIPGTPKPSLLKAGAEKIIEMFQLCPEIIIKKEWLQNGHLNIDATVRLLNLKGEFIASGAGSCATLESKYRYRTVAEFDVTGDPIPQDAKEKKKEYRQKGFGMKKVDGNWEWVKYKEGSKTENPDIADQYNTVLKMAVKRALVAATLMLGASDIFTQDIEDFKDNAVELEEIPIEVEHTIIQQNTNKQDQPDFHICQFPKHLGKDWIDCPPDYVKFIYDNMISKLSPATASYLNDILTNIQPEASHE